MCTVVEVGFGKTSCGIMALGLATAAGHKFILAKISIRIEETEGRSIVYYSTGLTEKNGGDEWRAEREKWLLRA